ncbi:MULTISPECIES: hypothetical protein [unclassified Cupriavidus]|uniref:hypothetical protein n=1 Tax=unclassified Cupriavidus TaxID=2640874 RepID=UPI00295E47A7|nr:hypothetical protein [Cupriavidus sp. TA19]
MRDPDGFDGEFLSPRQSRIGSALDFHIRLLPGKQAPFAQFGELREGDRVNFATT